MGGNKMRNLGPGDNCEFRRGGHRDGPYLCELSESSRLGAMCCGHTYPDGIRPGPARTRLESVKVATASTGQECAFALRHIHGERHTQIFDLSPVLHGTAT